MLNLVKYWSICTNVHVSELMLQADTPLTTMKTPMQCTKIFKATTLGGGGGGGLHKNGVKGGILYMHIFS